MKFLLATALLTGSISSFAATLSCGIVPIHADKGGYIMTGETYLLKTEIQKQGTANVDKCVDVTKNGHILTFCAVEAEYVGGYDVGLVVNDGLSNPIMNGAVLATSKKNPKELIKLMGDSEMLYSASSKLQNAKIDFPFVWDGGDSLQVDDAVAEGFRLKVLTHKEILYYIIRDCKLS